MTIAASPTGLSIDETGWVYAQSIADTDTCADARPPQPSIRVRLVHSPNADARPDDTSPSLLVVHNISLPPDCFGTGDIERLFTNTLDFDADPFYATIRGLRVSAHFLIARDGELIQFVSTQARAWHAGQSSFAGRVRCNDFSIGVELEGSDAVPFECAQYHTLAALTAALRARYPIDAVAGHADIAPGRKTDPGPFFDWIRFAEAANLPMDLMPFWRE